MDTIPSINDREWNMKNLITQLGATLGIPELALGDESYCWLFFDDLVLNMEWEAALSRFTIEFEDRMPQL